MKVIDVCEKKDLSLSASLARLGSLENKPFVVWNREERVEAAAYSLSWLPS